MPKHGFRITSLADKSALFEPGHGVNISAPESLIDEVLAELQRLGAKKIYFDLAEVEIIDSAYLSFLNRLTRACRCVGVEMVCIHMQPITACALAKIDSARVEFSTQHNIGFGD
ncbi:STAS domain-containing protein [Halorhodospira halochloris]|uniref:STAS domain-containing protein n=1 Tax=Halorhodospira halochloris TaxID=1052 RepID=UPI001EE9AB06|nr:STAS domain-containing protein [Halorhodospira halochloris]MCG5547772.1 hypothetical protein [Halorhodospira halochloris]